MVGLERGYTQCAAVFLDRSVGSVCAGLNPRLNRACRGCRCSQYVCMCVFNERTDLICPNISISAKLAVTT